MPWWDFYKLFTYAFEPDPLQKRSDAQQATGAGVTQPDAIPDIRQDGSFWGGGRGLIRLRDTNDFVDLSSVTNRTNRYKEYERLRNVAEIEMAMTVFADEACLAGKTMVATPFYGPRSIKWLAENKAGERFLVYCWDFGREDYTLGWAYNPRKVKTADTVRVKLDDGTDFVTTADHRILLDDQRWINAGQLTYGDQLMPFYREKAGSRETKQAQFPRIFTFQEGWKHERQIIDEWRTGEKTDRLTMVNRVCRMITEGASISTVAKVVGHDRGSISTWLAKEGFGIEELKKLAKKRKYRRVISLESWRNQDVYDLSVEKHANFCGESVVFHNCQRGENDHICEITIANEAVKEELEFLLFNRKMLNLDRTLWNKAKKLFIMGDYFEEVVINPDSPKDGILKMQDLPPDSVYRIETTKGKLIEFQQSKEGPDYQSLTRAPVTSATEADLQQATAIRFTADQVVHFKIGDDRKQFYPYGVSLIEPARGPAHQLRLMEDAMLVYRLTRAPERRVFYIDVATLAPARAEAFIERIKDQFRKKKVATNRGGTAGANAVEERWHPPAADEDYWLPIRQNSNTRIETLPGAQNLGEIDDALYFRNKLFTALNFPKNYFSNEDPNTTRVTLSAQDVKFARMIERLQAHLEDGIVQICQRHLQLRGVPEEEYDDLKISLTPPSDWRELSRSELVTTRINNANALKGSMLMSDFDIMTKWLFYTDDETEEMQARMEIQKLKDFRLQVLASNPQLLGIGVPGPGEEEIGAEAGGPNPMLAPGAEGGAPGGEGAPPEGGEQGAPGAEGGAPPEGGEQAGAAAAGAQAIPGTPPSGPGVQAVTLATPSKEDIKKFDLEIQSYAREQDVEEIDYSELG